MEFPLHAAAGSWRITSVGSTQLRNSVCWETRRLLCVSQVFAFHELQQTIKTGYTHAHTLWHVFMQTNNSFIVIHSDRSWKTGKSSSTLVWNHVVWFWTHFSPFKSLLISTFIYSSEYECKSNVNPWLIHYKSVLIKSSVNVTFPWTDYRCYKEISY